MEQSKLSRYSKNSIRFTIIDDLRLYRIDIKGAQDAGLHVALVQIGKFTQSDLDKGIKPDALLTDITDLAALLLP